MREELQKQFQSAKTKLSILVFKTTTIQLLTINSASEMQIAWHGYLDWLNVCLSQLQFSGQAPWATAEGPGIGKLFCSGHKMDSCHRIQLDSAGFGSSVRIRKEVWVLASINYFWSFLENIKRRTVMMYYPNIIAEMKISDFFCQQPAGRIWLVIK